MPPKLLSDPSGRSVVSAQMSERIIYPRPPIVEAIVEFRFAVALDASALAEQLSARIRHRYPKRQEQTGTETTVTVEPGGVSAKTQPAPSVIFLASDDELRRVGCTSWSLSLHVLSPYPGWERFREQIDEVMAAVPKEVSGIPIAALTVRYIDQVPLPEGADPGDYLTLAPRPQSLPNMTTSLHLVLQSDDSKGTRARLFVASSPPATKVEILYDLLLQRTTNVGCVADGFWPDIVEELHVRQRDVFEESITDRMRGLFQ